MLDLEVYARWAFKFLDSFGVIDLIAYEDLLESAKEIDEDRLKHTLFAIDNEMRVRRLMICLYIINLGWEQFFLRYLSFFTELLIGF